MNILTTSVTALRFLSLAQSSESHSFQVLFAGIGHHIHVYSQFDWEHPAINKTIFPPSVSIHGFSDVSQSNCVVAHAARMVAFLQLQVCVTGLLTDVHVVKLHNFEDWVWDTCWLSQDTSLLAVASGYSKTWVGIPPHFENFICIHSEDSQLTWSSTVFGDRVSNTFHVAAGSSFGELLIWKLGSYEQLCSYGLNHNQFNRAGVSPRQPHRLNAHHGPIMRITMSSDAQFMASVSVDRSVRVWHASRASNCLSCPSFGCYSPISTYFGHLGRVWDVAFVPLATPPIVASVSEDRTCRIWSSESEVSELNKYRDHSGNVWSIAVTDCPDGDSILIATGSEDGVVKTRFSPRYWLAKDTANDPTKDRSDATTTCFQLPGKLSNPRKFLNPHATEESGRTIVMTSSHSLLISTDFGRILSASWAPPAAPTLENQQGFHESVVWNEVYRDPDGTAFTPCSLIFSGGVVCGGQVDGSVVAIQMPFQQKFKDDFSLTWKRFRGLGTDCGMVMGLFGAPVSNKNTYDIFVAAANGNLHHWDVQVSHNDPARKDRLSREDAIVCRKIATYVAYRSTKSALVTSVYCLHDKKLVLVGDRGGRLHVFRIPAETEAVTGPPPCHALCWKRIHEDRISYFQRINCFEVLSCGFDGRIVTSSIKIPENSHEPLRVTIARSDRTVERMDTIVRAFLNVDKVETLVVGFRGAILGVWDLERRVERFQHNLGNWRRAHDIWCDDAGNVSVGYWRAGQLFIILSGRKRVSDLLCETYRQGLSQAKCGGAEFHSGRANDVVWIGEGEVMSGGEDTGIRTTRVDTKHNVFEKVQCLDEHISSVNSLSITPNLKMVASCGGADEVLLWEKNEQGLWRFETRIKIGDVIRSNVDSTYQSGIGAVMRATTIAGGFERMHFTERWYIWVVGRSDGRIIELSMKRVEESWNVRGKVLGAFDREAALSVCCNNTGNRTICGGSGGGVMIWDENGGLTHEVIRGHEGGVNCLAVKNDTRGSGVVVLSGGDDCQIKLWTERMQWRTVEKQGHHAAVTGIAWAERSDCLFVSGGADRRVCVWRSDGENIVLLSRIVTAVPDVGALIARVGTCFTGAMDKNDRVHMVTGLRDDSCDDSNEGGVVEVVVCGLGLQTMWVRLHE